MGYISPHSKVVGVFGGENLQEQIEHVGNPDGSSTHSEIIAALCKLNGLIDRPASLAGLFGITWGNPLGEEDYISSNSYRFCGIQSFNGQVRTEEPLWQVSEAQGGVLVASSNPDLAISVLEGEMDLDKYGLSRPTNVFLDSPLGQQVVNEAIMNCSLKPRVLSPNEVLDIPEGTIWSDGIAQGAIGYRYHLLSE